MRTELTPEELKNASGYVANDYLHYEDDMGIYEIHVGRKGRHLLQMLDEDPGIFSRYLEIDLFTGFVYLCIDNSTSGGLSYYYDINSHKMANWEILRCLYEDIQKPELAPSPEKAAVLKQLPCENWQQLLRTLPGWDEIIDHRLDALLLPQGKVCSVPADADGSIDPESVLQAPDGSSHPWKDLTGISVLMPNNRFSTRYWHHDYLLKEHNGQMLLTYSNDNLGAEFMQEDERFERYMDKTGFRWFINEAASLLPENNPSDPNPKKSVHPEIIQLKFGDDTVLLRDKNLAHWERTDTVQDNLGRFLKRNLNITE